MACSLHTDAVQTAQYHHLETTLRRVAWPRGGRRRPPPGGCRRVGDGPSGVGEFSFRAQATGDCVCLCSPVSSLAAPPHPAVTPCSAGCRLPRGLALTPCDPQSVLSVVGCVLTCPPGSLGSGMAQHLVPNRPPGCSPLCAAIHQGVGRVHSTVVHTVPAQLRSARRVLGQSLLVSPERQDGGN